MISVSCWSFRKPKSSLCSVFRQDEHGQDFGHTGDIVDVVVDVLVVVVVVVVVAVTEVPLGMAFWRKLLGVVVELCM